MSYIAPRVRNMLDSIVFDSLAEIAERIVDLDDEIDSLKAEMAELREENFDLSQQVRP